MFTVDQDKCTGDGICAAVCPRGLIKAPEQGGCPTPRAGAGELCLNCGHCLAVCPQGALSLQGMDVKTALPIHREWRLAPEQAAQFLSARRSIRVYQDKPVARELLEKVIGIASYAPSGSNSQPVQWLVVHNAKDVQRLAGLAIDWWRGLTREQLEQAGRAGYAKLGEEWDRGLDRICRKAPHLVIAYGSPSPGTQTSCIIALTYLELAAFAHGLGACWVGLFHHPFLEHPPLQQAVSLPAGTQAYGAMVVGYPKYQYYRIPTRKKPAITWL